MVQCNKPAWLTRCRQRNERISCVLWRCRYNLRMSLSCCDVLQVSFCWTCCGVWLEPRSCLSCSTSWPASWSTTLSTWKRKLFPVLSGASECSSDATIYRLNDISSRYWPYRIVSISSRKISKFRYIVIVSISLQYRRNDAYSMLSCSLYIHPTERRLRPFSLSMSPRLAT